MVFGIRHFSAVPLQQLCATVLTLDVKSPPKQEETEVTIEPSTAYGNGTTPTIRLAGKEWPLPRLAIRQQRVVVPAIQRFTAWVRSIQPLRSKMDKLQAEIAALRKAEQPIPDESFQEERKLADELIGAYNDMPPMVLDAIIDACYAALTRAHPKITREEFDGMEITVPELMRAITVITEQSGIFKPVSEGVSATGEAQTQESHPTGTA